MVQLTVRENMEKVQLEGKHPSTTYRKLVFKGKF